MYKRSFMVFKEISMYTFNRKVTYSEVNEKMQADIAQVVDYFQDCSTFQSEDLGVGLSYLEERHKAWLLASWHIQVLRYPDFGEDIETGTWAYDFKSMFGFRNFIVNDQAGNPLVKGDSTWVLVDTQTGHPVRVNPEDVALYGHHKPLDMPKTPRKIGVPKGGEAMDAFKVTRSLLDSNKHVNNAQYIRMALEYLPEDFGIQELQVEYRRAAVYGEVIVPYVTVEDTRVIVALCDQEEAPYVVVAFKK